MRGTLLALLAQLVIRGDATQDAYREFMFLGDSLFEYWMCYRPLDTADKGTDMRCVDFMDTYYARPLTLPVNCKSAAGSNSQYCGSSFQKAFPEALNLGRHGWRIDQWVAPLKYGDALTARMAAIGKAYKYVVIQLGANNIRGATDAAYVRESVRDLHELLQLLHAILPHVQIILLSTLPRVFVDVNKAIIDFNAHVKASFVNAKYYPYMQYVDVTQHFLDGNGNVMQSAYQDDTHLNTYGYAVFEEALKSNIQRIVGESRSKQLRGA